MPYHRLAPVIVLVFIAVAAGASPEAAPPPGKHWKLGPEAHRSVETFRSGKPVIGTSYFYWYDATTDMHMRDPDGTDALTTHPLKAGMPEPNLNSPDWHRAQLRDVAASGIDFVMPVFWGVPGVYDGWSFKGLPPLVAAHDRMLDEHRKDATQPVPPKIGLFYDTSTLQWNGKALGLPTSDRRIDLTTPEGRDWFYATIRDFFSMIPPEKWARIDGRPIVFLYSAGFAKAIDAKLFDDTRTRFEKEFGTGLFLVRHNDWPGKADAWYVWGGALNMTIGDIVAGLGPGYDHSAVPGREKLIVDRRGGRHYDEQWTRLLSMRPARRPWIVHVETWNEWHEGTDIARSEEYGDRFIRATARYAAKFHAGERVPRTGQFANASSVRWTADQPEGLRLLPSGADGVWERIAVDRQACIVSRSPAGGSYLYFDVDDSFLFSESGQDVAVAVTFRDRGCEGFRLDYDGNDPNAGPYGGAFHGTDGIAVGKSDAWKTRPFRLGDVRFVGRANGGDFRIAVSGAPGELVVREVTVRKLEGAK